MGETSIFFGMMLAMRWKWDCPGLSIVVEVHYFQKNVQIINCNT